MPRKGARQIHPGCQLAATGFWSSALYLYLPITALLVGGCLETTSVTNSSEADSPKRLPVQNLELFVERDRALSLEEVRAPDHDFQVLEEPNISLGVLNVPIWLRCTLQNVNNSNEDWVLDLKNPRLGHGVCPECFKALYPEYYGRAAIHRSNGRSAGDDSPEAQQAT